VQSLGLEISEELDAYQNKYASYGGREYQELRPPGSSAR
jgi:hypothetical protein